MHEKRIYVYHNWSDIWHFFINGPLIKANTYSPRLIIIWTWKKLRLFSRKPFFCKAYFMTIFNEATIAMSFWILVEKKRLKGKTPRKNSNFLQIFWRYECWFCDFSFILFRCWAKPIASLVINIIDFLVPKLLNNFEFIKVFLIPWSPSGPRLLLSFWPFWV